VYLCWFLEKLIYIRTKHDFTCVKMKSSFRKFYGRHHNLA
jgi:hypothetical protein